KAKHSARENCKRRAALYLRLSATSEWKIDRYVLNFDPYIKDLFKLSDEKVEAALTPVGASKEIFENSPADILMNKEPDSVLNVVKKEILADDSRTVYDAGRFKKIEDRLLKELGDKKEKEETVKRYREALDAISSNLYESTEIVFDKLIEKLGWNQLLCALAVFLKNPHSLELFTESINAYRIPQQVARVAWGLFGTVNGMMEVSGKDKSKILLNRTIDEIAYGKMSKESFRFPVYSQDELKDLFGDKASEILTDFIPIAERILSFDEVFEYFTSEGKEMLKLNWIKDVCPKVKGFSWKEYVVDKVSEELRDKLREEAQKILKLVESIDKNKELVLISNAAESLSKVSKKEQKKERYDEKRFVDDLCSDKKLFEKFYNAYPEKWKSYYEECNRKVGSDNA
ncbi:MAG: hypothetical protein Q4E99_03650, partial [Bacillota bacterium]|nr:hypothetical protein [Bacillota bacterium]